MDAWAEAFEAHKIPVAQLLLARGHQRAARISAIVRNTIHALHELGAIPVINENDTVQAPTKLCESPSATIDILAGMVAGALRADLLILLSVVDGILDARERPCG